MRTKLILAILLCIGIASCIDRNQTNNVNDIDSLAIDTSLVDSLDELSKIDIPENDNIEYFCDSVIGEIHIRHYTRNDSTGRFVLPTAKNDSRTLPYARKACLFVCDENIVYQKEITRAELHKEITVKDIESFQINSITAQSTENNSIIFNVSLGMEESLYFYEFKYEYSDGKFSLLGCKMFDAETKEELPM